MHVRVDPELCVLTGVCASLAPEVFDVGDHDVDVVRLLQVEVTDPELAERVMEAKRCCPAGAIAVED